MIANKKKFYTGLFGLLSFFVLLGVMFTPIFDGKNALAYADELFNSVSKDSAYQVPDLLEEAAEHQGTAVNVTIKMDSAAQADQTALLYRQAGAEAETSEAKLTVRGDLAMIAQGVLADADLMHQNDGAAVVAKYGYDEKRVMYNWWMSFDKMGKDLEKQGLKDEKKFVQEVKENAIEPAYNFYQIEAKSMSSKMGVVAFALVFYVVYTVWYGFSLMYMFEGWGLAAKH